MALQTILYHRHRRLCRHLASRPPTSHPYTWPNILLKLEDVQGRTLCRQDKHTLASGMCVCLESHPQQIHAQHMQHAHTLVFSLTGTGLQYHHGTMSSLDT